MATDDQQARVLGLAGARDAQRGEVRTYVIREPGNHTTDPPRTVTVVVSAACPAVVGRTPSKREHGASGWEVVEESRLILCGRARGVPVEETVLDTWTGIEYAISRWRNPCSHVDLHRDVYAEAERARLGETA